MTLHDLLFLAAIVFVAALYAARVVVRRAAPPPRTVESLAREVLAGQAELRTLIERAHGRLDEQRVYLDARTADLDRLRAAVDSLREQTAAAPFTVHGAAIDRLYDAIADIRAQMALPSRIRHE